MFLIYFKKSRSIKSLISLSFPLNFLSFDFHIELFNPLGLYFYTGERYTSFFLFYPRGKDVETKLMDYRVVSK